MTLTIPRAGSNPGRAAQLRTEPTNIGQSVAGFGQVMRRIGEGLENDALARERQRLSIDMTRDLNDLRLEVSEIGDPDAAERTWKARSDALRNGYLTGQTEDGTPRVSEKNAEQVGLMFDDLSNRHAFGLGREALARRQAQHEANYISYANLATSLAPSSDAEVRAGVLDQGFEIIAELEAAGVIDAAEAERRRLGMAGDMDAARAIRLTAEDPAAMIAALDGDDFSGLDAETRERYRVRAQSNLEAVEAAAEREAEKAAKEQERVVADRLSDIRGVVNAGGRSIDVEFLAAPEAQEHPDYAKTMAAVTLQQNTPNLQALPPAAIEELIVAEEARGQSKPFQVERLTALRELLGRHETGYAGDPIAYAALQGLDVPAADGIDPSSDTFLQDFSDRIAFGAELQAAGYTDDAFVFTEAERSTLKAALSPEADPAERARLSQVLVGGLAAAEGAGGALDRLGLDPLTRHLGGMQAAGLLSAPVAEEAFDGQAAIARDNIVLPPQRERLSAGFETLGGLFAYLPGGDEDAAELRAAADAIYAARLRLSGPAEDIDADAYRQALHEAMGGQGQFKRRSSATGGIQDVRNRATILPPGISAARVESGLEALRPRGQRTETRSAFTARAGAEMQANWEAISGGQVPMMGDEMPFAGDHDFQIMAIAPDAYVLVFETADGLQQVPNATGAPFTFSMRRLMRRSGQ